MEPCVPNLALPPIIAAVGSVLCAMLTIYLVHRRILADHNTKCYREAEQAQHELQLKALGVELAAAKTELAAKP